MTKSYVGVGRTVPLRTVFATEGVYRASTGTVPGMIYDHADQGSYTP